MQGSRKSENRWFLYIQQYTLFTVFKITLLSFLCSSNVNVFSHEKNSQLQYTSICQCKSENFHTLKHLFWIFQNEKSSTYFEHQTTFLISKIFSKLIANRVPPVLGTVISRSQDAFIILKWCIHHNFLADPILIKICIEKRQSNLSLELDIPNAFNLVN